MLKYVKSIYFFERICSYLDERKKLKLVKNNKSLQKMINVSIINYKLFKGNYYIFETNKILKEYNGYDNRLIYEGEYLNGEKNGKGKEYYFHGELLFEGEYLNGEKNGKGKEYYFHGELLFEGEYLNGEKNGKGKEYYANGKLKFEGEYLNGK